MDHESIMGNHIGIHVERKNNSWPFRCHSLSFFVVILYLLSISQSSAFTTLAAQESSFRAERQQHAALPVGIDGVMVFDGELYCYASGVLLKATRNGETVTALLPDTSLAAIAPDATFIVRHPGGDIYLTQPNRKGRSILMRLRLGEGRKPKLTQVKMNGMEVEHPTFTGDGRVMVFASRDGRSVGGYDLWYSLYDGKSWSKPINIGNRLNTKGDEFAPTICREYLVFASNARDERTGLYATRLISDRVTGDTVGMLQIGRSTVQHLPEPIDNPPADDYDLAVDTAGNCGYWVSTRSGSPQLHSFHGALDGVVLWGYVRNKLGRRMQGVRITVAGGDLSTITDSTGFYRIFLLGGRNYTLRFQTDGYFVHEENITTPKGDMDHIVSEAHHETIMDQLPLNKRIVFRDIFGPNADTELSDYGRRQLRQLIQFLRDNPNLTATISIASNLTDDESFNRLLVQQRTLTLQNHFYGLVPSSVRLRFIPGDSSDADSSLGISTVAVVLSK